MKYFTLDYIIVYAFLFITLLVGLWAGRGVKDMREYAIANKQFGTGPLTLTLLATYIGGWHLVGFPSDVFADGLIHIISDVVCGVVVCLLFIAWFIAPKMTYFKDCLTMGDVMYTCYGKSGKIIVGILGLIYNTAAVGIQIAFLGHICEFLGLRGDLGLILAVLVLTIYTAKGGMKSVTITDIIQFTAIVAAVPLLAHLLMYQAGGIRALLSSVPPEKLQFFNLAQEKSGAFSARYYTLPVITLWMLFPGFPLSFPFIQRMLMARDQRQIVNVYYISIAFLVSFFLLLTLIGLSALALYPHLDSHDILSHIVNQLPVGIKGMMWTALLAVVMSTVDSFLHAAGVSLTHDLIKPLLDELGIAINELKVVQYITLFIGCLSIIVTLFVRDIAKIAVYGMDLAALLFTVPLIAGIMGLKTDTRTFLVSLCTTLILFTLTHLYINQDLGILICIIGNICSFLGTHYFQHKGFAVVDRKVEQSIEYVWHPTREGIRHRLARLIPTPQKLLRYSQDRLDKYGANPNLFSLFIVFGYMVPLFMHSYANPDAYKWLLVIRGIGVFLCVGLLLKSQWPVQLLPYFPAYYHLSLLYCLPFVTTLLFLIEGGNIEHVVNIALSIMLLIVLVDWQTFIGLSITGVLLAFGIHRLVFEELATGIYLLDDIDTQYTLLYALTFATLIGLIFARRKQLSFDKLATDKQVLLAAERVNRERLLESFREKVRIIQTLRHAGIQHLLQVVKLIKELRVQAKGSPLAAVTPHLEATLIPMSLQLKDIEHRATDYVRLRVMPSTINELLNNTQEQLVARGRHQAINYRVPTQWAAVECDPEKIVTLLVNGIIALQQPAKEPQAVLVGVEDTQLHYPLPSVQEGYRKKVAALRITITTQPKLPPLPSSYLAPMDSASFSHPENVQTLMLLDNQRILKAHYGYSNVTEATQCYVIPVHLREVRPIDMDNPHMELGVAPTRADDHYPGAQAQEQAFLAAVAQRTEANVETVQTVLELIKWYHGPMKRQTGEPFYLHPLTVARLVLDYTQDEATILAALLHDTVEDTSMLLSYIEAVFGKETADIVDKVTHLESSRASFYKIKLSAEENILMLLASGNDRALYVKLADRLHNMRTIGGKPPASQVRIAKETLQFFVPQAQRLGLDEVAQELQTRSWKILKNDN